jgi:hypothetical protein
MRSDSETDIEIGFAHRMWTGMKGAKKRLGNVY